MILCPKCGAKTRVYYGCQKIEQGKKNWSRYQRYRKCPNNHTFSTLEIIGGTQEINELERRNRHARKVLGGD